MITDHCATGGALDAAPWVRALLLAFLIGASPAAADTPDVAERWKCGEVGSDYAVELVVFADRSTGQITAPGVTHETAFRVHGLSLIWLWRQDEEARFIFEIHSGRQGVFFDLGYPEDKDGMIEAKQVFTCNKDS